MRARTRPAASLLTALLATPSADEIARAGLSNMRRLALLLVACLAWSFAIAPVALSVTPQAPRPAPVKPFTTEQIRQTLAEIERGRQRQGAVRQGMLAHAGVIREMIGEGRAGGSAQASQRRPAVRVTLLDEVGRLARPVPAARVAAWTRQLKTTRTSSARAATLHLWLGEVALARDEQPLAARWHFRQARLLSRSSGGATGAALYGLAAYDAAVSLYAQGAYADAADAFGHLLSPHGRLAGYDPRTCALWLRHASACAGYHEQRARLGIPEPPQLDPECGVAALAASLRALRLPYDRKTLLRACRVTGEGSTMADLVAGARRLGVAVRPVSADDRGLMSLPKPLIAFVEQDHFVSVVRADGHGVSYLCSDCGPWPGGRVDLTWRQWHALGSGVFAAVARPGSAWDRSLAALPVGAGRSRVRPLRVASVGPLAGLAARQERLAVGHVSALSPAHVFSCGFKPTSTQCQDFLSCLFDGPGGGPGGGGPGGNGPGGNGPGGNGPGCNGDPVNLANGEEQYTPSPDLVVYNPLGPSVVWQRTYNSLRGMNTAAYDYDDFGSGWSQTYNVGVYDPSNGGVGTANPKFVILSNGGRVQFTAPQAPTAGAPVQCSVQQGAPYLVEWDYDAAGPTGHFTITLADRTRWVTTTAQQSANTDYRYDYQVGLSFYQLSQVVDRNGNAIHFNYAAGVDGQSTAGYPLLSSITDSAGVALLTIQRDGYHQGENYGYASANYGNVTAVTDRYGRAVTYQGGRYGSYDWSPEVTQVSEVVAAGAGNPPAPGTAGAPLRYTYGYQDIQYSYSFRGQYYSNEVSPFLGTITVPSPSSGGPATSTATINYDSASLFVSSLVDGNGYTRSYQYNTPGANQTTVTVSGGSGAVYSYVGGYDRPVPALAGDRRQRQNDQLYLGRLRQHAHGDAAQREPADARRSGKHVQLHELSARRIDADSCGD